MAESVDGLLGRELVVTEKMDGSSAALARWLDRPYARSHSGAPTHPSFDALKGLHAARRWMLPPDVMVFAEWCRAVHTLEYENLPADPASQIMLFAARRGGEQPESAIERASTAEDDGFGGSGGVWLAWDDVARIAAEAGLPTVPVLERAVCGSAEELRVLVESHATSPSVYGGEREGVVVRAVDSFADERFGSRVAKWVRPDFVPEDQEHWSRGMYRKHGERPRQGAPS